MIHYGLGPIGLAAARLVLGKPGMVIAAAPGRVTVKDLPAPWCRQP